MQINWKNVRAEEERSGGTYEERKERYIAELRADIKGADSDRLSKYVNDVSSLCTSMEEFHRKWNEPHIIHPLPMNSRYEYDTVIARLEAISEREDLTGFQRSRVVQMDRFLRENEDFIKRRYYEDFFGMTIS